MIMLPHNAILRRSLTMLIGTGIILLPAGINGFPFVYSDTGTYIRSAFEGYVPYDRPYWYGVFVRWASGGGISLWGVALAQSLLCALYVVRVAGTVLPPARVHRTALIACAGLTAGTGLGWYAGQLIPDIFSGIGLLAIYLLLRGRNGRWRIFDCLVIAAACWMHLSNLLILPLAGLVLHFLGKRHAPLLPRKQLAWLGLVVLIAWGGLALANRAVEGTAHISRSGHVFLLGRMIDMGMLQPFLEEHCATEHFALCAHIDSLPPTSAAFLWAADSPVMKEGGWGATREEYMRILKGSVTEMRYLLWHIRGSLTSTVQQLGAWEICQGLQSPWYRTVDAPPYRMIEAHMPQELTSYQGAMQNGGRGELDMRWPDRLYQFILALSLVLAIWWLAQRHRGAQVAEARVLLIFSLWAVLIGAWACATLSVVDTRYLGRDAWLLPLSVFLLLRSRYPGALTGTSSPNEAATGSRT